MLDIAATIPNSSGEPPARRRSHCQKHGQLYRAETFKEIEQKYRITVSLPRTRTTLVAPILQLPSCGVDSPRFGQ